MFIKTHKKILLTVSLLYLFHFSGYADNKHSVVITVKGSLPTDTIIPHIANNINIWHMGSMFYNPVIEYPEFNEFTFVKWVQLMQCSGGSESRDLFTSPVDKKNRKDYNFTPLIKNCAGILTLGARPHLILGSVPLKLTKQYKKGNFDTNVYPPDSYTEYYNYIKSLAEALVARFGIEEVRNWKFGCMTEYENKNWFRSTDENPENSFIEFCKLYDYTVQALVDVLGRDIYVGAHSMTCAEGEWDEIRFIEHVASGKNWATGKKGTRISYLSSSFYDLYPGVKNLKDIADVINVLQEAAKKNGLDDLVFGIDEGRILRGINKGTESADLNSRTSGYSWQGAYDARLYHHAINCGINYISSWSFLTGGNLRGFPTISYHVAKEIDAMGGCSRLPVAVDGLVEGCEIECLAASSKDNIRLMIYGYSQDITSTENTEIKLRIDLPYKKRKVKVHKKIINDDCNFFDEWLEDRKVYNIEDSSFYWSPDDPTLDDGMTLRDKKAINLYKSLLRGKYVECSRLKDTVTKERARKGKLSLNLQIQANSVVFIDIARK